jgi:DegV family protein with EDD domain
MAPFGLRYTCRPVDTGKFALLVAGTPAHGIAYLDGVRLHRALSAGIRRVLAHQEELNRINVFPVADADTGTNLAATLRSVLEATSDRINPHAGTLLGTVAESALDGARGNSGAIFAQFLQGLSEESRKIGQLSAERFSRAVSEGARCAREALAEPREGTILTVITAFADEIAERIAEGVRDFRVLVTRGLERSRQSLAETQYQLPQLEKAGVVDAGALGFVEFLEGILAFVQEGDLRALEDTRLPSVAPSAKAACDDDAEVPKYRFCTECVVSGESIDRQKLRAAVGALAGDSLVVAGTSAKTRVHCHVDNPAVVFLTCEQFGEVTAQKADDMYRQLATARNRQAVAVVTDSGADLPAEALEQLDIHVVPLRIQVAGRDYLDKVTLTPGAFFDALRRGGAAPTTSQPPPGDYRRQFNFLGAHHQSVVVVTLSSAVSGTWQAAKSAAGRADHDNVTVFDTRNAAAGQGLLAMYAAECAAAGWDAPAIVRSLERLGPETRTFAVVDDLSHAVRGGRVPRSFKFLADHLRLTPILATNRAGRITLKGVFAGRRNLAGRLARRVARGLDPQRPWRVLVGHCDCEPEGRALRRALVERIPHVHSAYLTEAGAAIGAHAGPGSLVVAVQPYEPPGAGQHEGENA